jgi:ABC-2 type transport system ATP-binding protein
LTPIAIDRLSKSFKLKRKQIRALDEVSLSVQAGESVGFIGPNGAGKSTTIKILATLLKPSSGQAMVDGLTVGYQNRQIRPVIGYVPDFMGAYEDMVVTEYLEFFAACYNINGPQRKKVVGDVLDLTDLHFKATAEVNSLSRGMQQRLSIARVLLHDPKVLLMDEPASGLDPRARIEIRELLKELKRMGKTIIISSHILPELADFCNTVGIIEKGKLLFSGSVPEAMRRAKVGNMVHVAVADRTQQAAVLIQKLPGVNKVTISEPPPGMKAGHGDGRVINVSFEAESKTDFTDVPNLLVNQGFRIVTFTEEAINLETAFMRLTKGAVQ